MPARAALAAAFTALVINTMSYAAFLEDPFTWVVMATGLAIAPFARLAGGRMPRRGAVEPARATGPLAPAGS
jgi:hypothetical protein